VQSIIRELRGEKIDIIEYSEDPVTFATNALSPAKISRVAIVDSLGKHMEVIVDDTQLSLAIGKKGQNVRLAAKLLGWKIDIKSEEEKRQEVESVMQALVVPGAPVSVLLDHGMSEGVVENLLRGSIGTVERLGGMTPEQLQDIAGIGPDALQEIQTAVNAYYGQYEPAPGTEADFPETAPEAGGEALSETLSTEAVALSEPVPETPAAEGGTEAAPEQQPAHVVALSDPDLETPAVEAEAEVVPDQEPAPAPAGGLDVLEEVEPGAPEPDSGEQPASPAEETVEAVVEGESRAENRRVEEE
jgi:transcription termination/antitermination protein NusA